MCRQVRLFVVCLLGCLLFCFCRCSMRRSGATFVEQHTFCCITCGISGKNGICATCAVRFPPPVLFRVYKVTLAIWNGTEGRREYASCMWTETGRQTDRKTGIFKSHPLRYVHNRKKKKQVRCHIGHSISYNGLQQFYCDCKIFGGSLCCA